MLKRHIKITTFRFIFTQKVVIGGEKRNKTYDRWKTRQGKNDGWANGYKLGLRYWEIWNEPEGHSTDGLQPMWSGGTFDEMLELYKKVATAIKAYDSSLKVGGLSFMYCDFAVEPFLKFCRQENLSVDFLSFHHYAQDLDWTIEQANSAKSLLGKYGFKKSEIIIAEWTLLFLENYDGSYWDFIADPVHQREKNRELFENQKNNLGASFIAAFLIKHGYYYIIFTYKDENGKRCEPWFNTNLTIRGNKKEALKLLDIAVNNFKPELLKRFKKKELNIFDPDMLADKPAITSPKKIQERTISETKTNSDSDKVLFGDYLTEWLEIVKHTIEPNTYMGYKNKITRNIAPYFNKRGITLQDLTENDIQEYYNEELQRVKAKRYSRL